MSFCEQIGRWASSLAVDELPPSVRERAALQELGMLAAREAGAEAAAPFATVAPEGPVGEVYAGAAASIAHDWDDYLFMGHTGHSAVWAARAFAPEGERRLLAQVAANEVAGRLGAALFLGPHNGQFWASIHCAGAAVAAGVGLGLDAEGLAHAVAIALYQPPYGLWPGFMGAQTKLLTAAEPAAQGARAALLAAEGVEGALDLVENRRGLLAHFSFVPRPGMLGGLGEVWLTDTMAFKPLPGCAYLQAAVDAALRADVGAAEVDLIEVESGYLTCGMEVLGAGPDLTPVRVNFSAALSVAIALHAGRLTPAELRPRWLAENEGDLRALAGRINVVNDWDLTLQTLRGTIDAGARLDGIGLRGFSRIRRRMSELAMDEISIGRDALGQLLRKPEARRLVRSALAVSRSGGGGTGSEISAIDTSRLRLSFPSRLRIRLRSGRLVEVEGRELGAAGSPLAEQREVITRKQALVVHN